MRIFFYNWVQFDDPEKRGGGVTLYQRNLIETLIQQGHEIVFLSSGVAYNILRKRSYIRRTRNCFGSVCASFELVNSPVLAPSHTSFDLIEEQFSNTEIRNQLARFMDAHGPFDVAHFNNLEGLPFSVVDLKQQFPDTRLVYSAHNYFSVCPQVNLWQNESRNCTDFAGGRNCVTCLKIKPNPVEERLANTLAFHLKSIGIQPQTWAFRRVFQLARIGNRLVTDCRRLFKKPLVLSARETEHAFSKAPAFASRRARLVALIEKNFDTILAVSEQTRSVLIRFGFAPERVEVCYIGTKHGQLLGSVPLRPVYTNDRPLKVAYLGYMRADKGFWFLLDALENMSPDLARQIELVVAARDTGKGSKQRLKVLENRLHSVKFFDGYTQDSIDEVLAGTDLGIIPPLWEDNLPQVAIEIVARGIPIVTSDAGGAQELGNNPDFTFKAGSMPDLLDRLQKIVDGNLKLSEFWHNHMTLRTMQAHVDELLCFYQPSPSVSVAAAE